MAPRASVPSMSKNMRPLIFIAAPPLKSCPSRVAESCESAPYDSSARHVGSVCISLQAPIRALTLAFSRRHRFLSGRIGTIIAGSGFCCDTRGDAICLGFTHLVDPWLTDEHIHDLCAVDPAPPGKVVRLAHRVAHAMDSDAVVLDVVPHTDPLACGGNRTLAGCRSRLNLGTVPKLRRCGGEQQPKPSLYPSVLRTYSRSRSTHRPRPTARRACERS